MLGFCSLLVCIALCTRNIKYSALHHEISDIQLTISILCYNQKMYHQIYPAVIDNMKLKPFVYDLVLGWRIGHFICDYQVGRDSASEKT